MSASITRISEAVPHRALFTATIFLSAFLLFSVQPMFARMVLPAFGGAPTVWAIAVCFFQALLLLGYAYAHGLEKLPAIRPGLRSYWIFLPHVALLGFALTGLPLALPSEATASASSGGTYQALLLALAMGVGLPFFALSANAPLLQAWFGRLGHERSADPYFLYAASNAGSMIALISYPLVIEPLMPLGLQSKVWSAGFVLLGFLIAACGYLSSTAASRAEELQSGQQSQSLAPAGWALARDRAQWAFLAFVPSGLLVAFTTFVTTDLASAPLIWVIPLAVYLATFIVAFRNKPLPGRRALRFIQPGAAGITLWASQSDATYAWAAGSVFGLVTFALVALECHLRLYERRPSPSRLTDYYLWISAGGALGGLFASLIAPIAFTDVVEFPLFLGLGTIVCILPAQAATARDLFSARSLALAGGAVAISAILALLESQGLIEWSLNIKLWVVAILAVLLAVFSWRPALAQASALSLIAAILILPAGNAPLFKVRSFFGTHKVVESTGGRFHFLVHGMTLHGIERIKKTGERPSPLSYYHESGPLARGLALARLAAGSPKAPLKIGIVGLGTGAMACHALAGDNWRFFEIDRAVIKIARNAPYFTYLRDCQPNAGIVLGDARLTLSRLPPKSFDFLMIDAFSSDAIPIHLLTVEAIRLYASLLTENGVLAMHLSNQNLDLPPVIEANVSAVGGLTALFAEGEGGGGATPSQAVLIARKPEIIAPALSLSKARMLGEPKVHPWTDDYSNIVSALIRRYRDRIAQNE